MSDAMLTHLIRPTPLVLLEAIFRIRHLLSDAMLAHLIRPTVTQTMPNRRPDKALAPHPALLPNSSAAIMSDAILAHLIRPTPLVLLGAIF